MERIIFKCLAKHPDDRYANAADLMADLEEVEAKQRPTMEIGLAPPGTTERLAIRRAPKKKFPWTLVLLGIGLVVLAGLVVKLMR